MSFIVSTARKLAICGLAAATLFACRTKDRVNVTPTSAAYGKLNIHIDNKVGGAHIDYGTMAYHNVAGNNYSINLFKYLVSNFTLVKADNTTTNYGRYKLIDGSDSTNWGLSIDSVKNGTYTAIRFYLGVDSAHNHTILYDGDLNPSNGMTWDWNTGYIFFKHEGQYRNGSETSKALVYHYGLDANLVTVDIPISSLTLDGNTKTLNLQFDLNSLYNSPNSIDFTNNSNRQSTESGDKVWLSQMKENFAKAFTFVNIQ